MVLLADEAQVDARFSPFRDSANVDASYVHSLHQAFHRLRKSFWTHPMVLLGHEAQEEARFGVFADRANLDTR